MEEGYTPEVDWSGSREAGTLDYFDGEDKQNDSMKMKMGETWDKGKEKPSEEIAGGDELERGFVVFGD